MKCQYVNAFAVLVKHGFTLEDVMPNDWKEKPWVKLFYNNNIDVVNHPCWKIPYKTLTRNELHYFLTIWLFWIIFNHDLFDDELPKKDFIDLRSILQNLQQKSITSLVNSY